MPAALMRWRLAAALALLAAAPLAAEPVQMSLPQARAVAQAAFLSDEFALANALARRLLQADPKDPLALLLLTATEPRLGNPAAGRWAGQQAWRQARGAPVLRYEIARHTAVAAFAEGRPGLAQFWLRRAADTAPSPEARDQTVADFRQVRAGNPLRLGVDLAVTPSSNLNGGAQGGLLMIDNSYVLGTLSGSAQALSGVRTVAQARLDYALPAGARSQTRLGLQFFGSLNRLSAEAKALAPDMRGADLDQVTLEARATHDFLWPGSRHPISLTLATGQSWAGGTAVGPHLRAEVATPLLQGENGVLQLLVSGESQWMQGSGRVDAGSVGLEGTLQADGGRLGWSLALTAVQGEAVNRNYRGVSGQIGYDLEHLIGPVALSGRLSGAIKDYPRYMLGPFAVTDGRLDRQIGVALDATFTGIGVMGFSPKVSLSGTQTWSNISRFQTRQIGMTLGFESQF